MPKLADVWYEGNGASYGRDQHYNSSRYHMLNLHATFTKGTIEFRLFQFADPHDGKKGGLHAGELKAYIQLCLAMSQLAKEVKYASPKPQQTDNEKYAFRCWMLRLGLHRRGIRNGKGDPSAEHGGQRKLAQRISADLHGHLSGGQPPFRR